LVVVVVVVGVVVVGVVVTVVVGVVVVGAGPTAPKHSKNTASASTLGVPERPDRSVTPGRTVPAAKENSPKVYSAELEGWTVWSTPTSVLPYTCVML
jgi:hypothetical protein